MISTDSIIKLYNNLKDNDENKTENSVATYKST